MRQLQRPVPTLWARDCVGAGLHNFHVDGEQTHLAGASCFGVPSAAAAEPGAMFVAARARFAEVWLLAWFGPDQGSDTPCLLWPTRAEPQSAARRSLPVLVVGSLAERQPSPRGSV